MARSIQLLPVIAAMSMFSCYAMQDWQDRAKSFVSEAEIDLASIKLTRMVEYTGVQHNGHAYEIARIMCYDSDVVSDGKPFVFFNAHRWGIGAARNEDISQEDFAKAKTTPNAKRYTKEEYFAYLKGAPTTDSSVKSGWVATCRTNDGTADTFESRRQTKLYHNPDVDRSEAAFKAVQLAYSKRLGQQLK